MGTKVERASANPNLFQRGDLIPGIRIDGMDVLAVREATKIAIKHCEDGNGPILVEALTYRFVNKIYFYFILLQLFVRSADILVILCRIQAPVIALERKCKRSEKAKTQLLFLLRK